ncbi:ABC transporter ATP-binding protein [Streptococcus pneumoniae]|nr:ABC transporter ATP-binding protein [Streptococcus pneumoniae]
MFEGTIRDNILLEENYTDEEILQSLEQVGLSVKDFPNNILDYYVGETIKKNFTKRTVS